MTVLIDWQDYVNGGVARYTDGTTLAPDRVRRLLCDAKLNFIQLGEHQEPLWMSRTVRTATPRQWRALIARDRHCAFPGCTTKPSRCEAHHIREYDQDHGRLAQPTQPTPSRAGPTGPARRARTSMATLGLPNFAAGSPPFSLRQSRDHTAARQLPSLSLPTLPGYRARLSTPRSNDVGTTAPAVVYFTACVVPVLGSSSWRRSCQPAHAPRALFRCLRHRRRPHQGLRSTRCSKPRMRQRQDRSLPRQPPFVRWLHLRRSPPVSERLRCYGPHPWERRTAQRAVTPTPTFAVTCS